MTPGDWIVLGFLALCGLIVLLVGGLAWALVRQRARVRGSVVFDASPMTVAPAAPTEIPQAAISPRGVPMDDPTEPTEITEAILAAWEQNERDGGSTNPGQLAAVAARAAAATFTFPDTEHFGEIRFGEPAAMRWVPPDTERALQLAVDLGAARQDNGPTVLALAVTFLRFMRTGTVEDTAAT